LSVDLAVFRGKLVGLRPVGVLVDLLEDFLVTEVVVFDRDRRRSATLRVVLGFVVTFVVAFVRRGPLASVVLGRCIPAELVGTVLTPLAVGCGVF
jgi:hypothetical protein